MPQETPGRPAARQRPAPQPGPSSGDAPAAPALLTVTRVVQAEDLGEDRASRLLSAVRKLVREAREVDPGLVGYRLYDVGLVRRGAEVLVHLYFYR